MKQTMWVDKLYFVFAKEGILSTIIYWLSTPFLLALYFSGYMGSSIEPFGYSWVPQDKRVILQNCNCFSKDFGTCSNKVICPLLFNGEKCLCNKN